MIPCLASPTNVSLGILSRLSSTPPHANCPKRPSFEAVVFNSVSMIFILLWSGSIPFHNPKVSGLEPNVKQKMKCSRSRNVNGHGSSNGGSMHKTMHITHACHPCTFDPPREKEEANWK